jgi:hypothetical protein
MARKIYKTTKGISLSMRLILPGQKEKVSIDFKGGVTFPRFKPSYYETSDERIQTALEKTKFFNVKFVLDKEVKDARIVDVATKKQDPVADNVKEYGQRTVQTAAAKLAELGANPETLNSLEDVLAVAKSLNVSFPALEK